ncbi:MAG: tripartite tricarboxylate transporter substrate binding protein [Betaproteobacteria bacterium]
MNRRFRVGTAVAVAVALAMAAPHAVAQPKDAAYPTKPIRMIVASGAGGGLDFVARLVSPKITESMGQQVVVDNRAGASGSIAAELAANATPDGYTVMLMSASLVVYGIVNKTRYDLYRDFAPVSQVAAAPYILTVNPSLPVNSVKELIAHAKKSPAKLNYASTGNASFAHLATELFAHTGGIQLVHIPYKGVGAALPDMLSGQIHLSLLSVGSVYSHVRSGKLKALAIATRSRAKIAPQLPTMIEAGVSNFVVTQWHGLLAPRATPRAIVERLYREVVAAVNHPDVASRFAVDGTEGVGSTPAQFAEHLKSERDQWAKVVKLANIRTE